MNEIVEPMQAAHDAGNTPPIYEYVMGVVEHMINDMMPGVQIPANLGAIPAPGPPPGSPPPAPPGTPDQPQRVRGDVGIITG
jgi:hypothetical protein